jgi:hypothetical protein
MLMFWAGAALSVLAACNPTPGEGLFDAQALQLNGCDEEVMPWVPGFFTIDQFENKVTIRLQSIGGGIETIDGIFIQVDKNFVDESDGEGMPLGDPVLREVLRSEGHDVPAATEGEPVGGVARGVLGFYESCPEATVVPEVIGRLRFTSFEPFNGGQITGFVTAPVIADTRTNSVIGEGFTGRFSFQVQKGRPYTNFTGPGNQTP